MTTFDDNSIFPAAVRAIPVRVAKRRGARRSTDGSILIGGILLRSYAAVVGEATNDALFATHPPSCRRFDLLPSCPGVDSAKAWFGSKCTAGDYEKLPAWLRAEIQKACEEEAKKFGPRPRPSRGTYRS